MAGVSHLGTEFSTWSACEALGRDPVEIGSQLSRLAERGEVLIHADHAGGDTTRMTFRFVNAMLPSLLNPAHGIHVYAGRALFQ
jgi:hypothetical protein